MSDACLRPFLGPGQRPNIDYSNNIAQHPHHLNFHCARYMA